MEHNNQLSFVSNDNFLKKKVIHDRSKKEKKNHQFTKTLDSNRSHKRVGKKKF